MLAAGSRIPCGLSAGDAVIKNNCKDEKKKIQKKQGIFEKSLLSETVQMYMYIAPLCKTFALEITTEVPILKNNYSLLKVTNLIFFFLVLY